MKKIISLVAALLICVTFLCGCGMVVDIGTVIEKNGSGTVTASIMLDEELYNTITGMGDDYDDSIGDLEPIMYHGERYYGYKVDRAFSSIEELKTILTSGFNLAGDSTELEGPIFTSLTLSKTEMRGTVNKDFIDLDMGEAAGYVDLKTIISFTFPYEITETNGSMLEDKRTVSWTVDDFTPELYVKTKNPMVTNHIIGGSVLVLLIICLVVVSTIRKKKAAASSVAEEDIPTETKAPAQEEVAEMQDVQTQEPVSEPAETGIKPGIKYCSNCGTPQPEDAQFCNKCGSKLI